jgi:AI-2 transport protein TqsA
MSTQELGEPPDPAHAKPAPDDAPPSPSAPDHSAIPEKPPHHGESNRWQDRLLIASVAGCLVIAATGWYLLKEFAPLLRPLFLATFFCYVILPSHRRLTQRIPPFASIVVLAGVSVGFMVLVALQILGSAAQLTEEMPRLIARGEAIVLNVETYIIEHLPPWLAEGAREVARGQTQSAGRLQQAVSILAAAAADTLTEAVLVGIYLIFLLVEAGRVPRRIEGAFTGDRASEILSVVGNINEAMAGYLLVKVKASLVLALPATVVLWAFGVKFAAMWGLLTFLLNFIPYLGSIISCGTPILLAYLQMESLTTPTVVAALLISIHTLSAYVVEPAMTGRAVGLSPLIILLALSFWGLCWGLTGMLLAVPLTVMMKIVLENVEFTRPVAHLMAED